MLLDVSALTDFPTRVSDDTLINSFCQGEVTLCVF